MKLRAGVKISVVVWQSNVTNAPWTVKPARIVKVTRTRFMRMIHYRLEPTYTIPRRSSSVVATRGTSFTFTSENDGAIQIDDKGKTWVVGWEGPQVRALATVAALGGGE